MVEDTHRACVQACVRARYLRTGNLINSRLEILVLDFVCFLEGAGFVEG
jgi:hypothetical protein